MEINDLMQHAIEAAKRGIAAGQSPFGCAVACEGRLLVATHNTVVSGVDITAHAEINALRQACQLRSNIHLPDCVVASTCEPCPMCMAALHWARVPEVCYGATIDDAAGAGFNELRLPAKDLLRQGNSQVRLTDGVQREACAALFDDWLQSPSRQAY